MGLSFSDLREVVSSKGLAALNRFCRAVAGHKHKNTEVGLENVTNDAQVKRSEMGEAEGVATLNENGHVPSEQIYVAMCKAYNDAAQSIATSSDTIMDLPKEYFDSDTMHDLVTNDSRITFKTAGKYTVGAQIQFATNSTGMRAVAILLNGTTYIARQQTSASSAGRTALMVSTIHEFAVDDYIVMTAYQNRGSALNTDVSDLMVSMWAHKVSD